MRSADYVQKQLERLKKAGTDLMLVAWQIALLCVGWAYVFGALGEYCTPANRRKYNASHGADHPTIKSKCQVIRADDPKSSCDGCKWYPGEERTRIFDCRGFTRWILKVVYGFTLSGAGATSQWNSKVNWAAKGKIKTIPKDKLVCVFQYNSDNGKMKHTGLAYNGETVECQVGVQHKKLDSRWTHWALPKCVDPSYVPPKEEPQKEEKPVKKHQTIRKGNHGEAVKTCQQMLQKLGYDLGVCGIDSDFGIATEKAVKAFQKDHNLTADGVVGEKTWTALEKAVESPAPAEKLYTVKITGQKKAVAEQIIKQYGGTMTAE